jgi:hypothetical protein
MDFKINKTTEEIISVDVPKYFKSKYGSQLTKLDWNGITKVSNTMIMHQKYDETSIWQQKDIIELLQCEEIDSDIFDYKFETALNNLKNLMNGISNLQI